MQVGFKSDKGLRRSNNEDAVKVITTPDEPRWMGIVCDGMGGHAMGETASETVIDAIAQYWQETTAPPTRRKKYGKPAKRQAQLVHPHL